MGFFTTAAGGIRIIDWVIKRYESIKTKFKKWNRRRVEKSIRKAVDNRDIKSIRKRLKKIIGNRSKRRDS